MRLRHASAVRFASEWIDLSRNLRQLGKFQILKLIGVFEEYELYLALLHQVMALHGVRLLEIHALLHSYNGRYTSIDKGNFRLSEGLPLLTRSTSIVA